jgi:hypothetical protein
LPLSKTVIVGLAGALLLIVSDPLYAMVAVGVNVTLIVQFAPCARVVPQLVVREKLAEAVMLLIVSGPGPALDSVTV